MVAIDKSEKEVISEQLPNVHIIRTAKQKSKRHHYFCEESKQVMSLLAKFRSEAHTQEGA